MYVHIGENKILRKKDIQFIRFPFKLNLRFFRGVRWMNEPHCMGTLGRNHCSPGEFGWID